MTVILIGGMVAVSSKDFFYFSNGSGGEDWLIGKPLIGLFDAHQSRSLAESRALALELVNRDRQLNNLSPLTEDPLLSKAAQKHAEDMLARQYYDHITPEGKTPTDRFADLGGQQGVGENILEITGSIGATLNYRLIEESQKSWMYSPGHRENLLIPDYQRFGYGIVTNPITGQVYAVSVQDKNLKRIEGEGLIGIRR
ncbi:CAP domain-containing protein [Synechococcus sp. BDU 130192]|nr:CAP domain-containing protein [Synechococcus sp. BDU 130192]